MIPPFRDAMKVVIHEVNGRKLQLYGKSLESETSALNAVMELPLKVELHARSKVYCSYVEPSWVHSFDSMLLRVEPLALNHRLVRVTIASPTATHRFQRRESLRVTTDIEVQVQFPDDAGVPFTSTALDLSAGGMALRWESEEPREAGTELLLTFSTARFEHVHKAHIVAMSQRDQVQVVHLQFLGLSDAAQNRLVNAIFALHREAISQAPWS